MIKIFCIKLTIDFQSLVFQLADQPTDQVAVVCRQLSGVAPRRQQMLSIGVKTDVD